MDTGKGKIRFALLLLGTNAIAVQILLLREFISASYGNELVIGLVLAAWMVLTAAGAFLAGRMQRFSLQTLLALLAILPTVIVFLLRILRNLVFVPGMMAGITGVALFAFLLLAPFCLLSGYTFVRCSAVLGFEQAGAAGAFAYAWESVGSVIGGIVFNVLLTRVFDVFQTLSLLTAAGLIGVVLAFGIRSGAARVKSVILIAAILLCTATEFLVLDRWTTALTYPGQELVYSKGTPYGTLTVTRQQEQLNFYEDHTLVFSTGDVVGAEENVHYAMLQRPASRRVLLIGGGIAGITREVLKYPVDRVDYLEQNPWVLDIGRRFTSAFEDKRIIPIHDDARMYLQNTDEQYDAVLVNLPDPSTVQVNRYYTIEFFREVKKHLHEGGVFALAILPATEYQGAQALQIHSMVYATIHRVFSNVLLVPGARQYFIASDSTLDIHIGRLIGGANIATEYVNSFYIDDTLLEARSNSLTARLTPDVPSNTDFHPICASLQLSYWSSYFGADPVPWITSGALILAAALFWRFRPVGSSILASGFAAASSEIVLLTAFQAIYGSLYEMTGLLITTFMAGLAVGSFVAGKGFPASLFRALILLQMVVAVLCAFFPLLFSGVHDLASWAGHLVILSATFALACLTGAEFPLAISLTSGTGKNTISSLYGLDLLGSAAGALFTGIYVIPAIGIAQASFVAAGVAAASALVCVFSGTSHYDKA